MLMWLMSPRRRAAALLGATLLWAPCLLAFVDGPLPGMTGGFGEPSCQACHWAPVVDAPGTRLRVSGFPESYTPGARYRVTVSLEEPDLPRGGFQLAVRFAGGEAAGGQAGALTALDEKAWIVAAGEPPVEYAQHSAAGTRARAGLLTWELAWTAPGAAHPVLLHVAANAANDDASPLGDRVYLRSYGSVPSRPSPDG
jgi:hypothetical protein